MTCDEYAANKVSGLSLKNDVDDLNNTSFLFYYFSTRYNTHSSIDINLSLSFYSNVFVIIYEASMISFYHFKG